MDQTRTCTGACPEYESLLTALCQTGLAAAIPWSVATADEEAAQRAVVTWAAAFGGPAVRPLIRALDSYVDRGALRRPLVPLVRRDGPADDILHVTTDSAALSETLDGRSIVVWDAGRGLRLGRRREPGQSKGDVVVAEGYRLREFAAGAAGWCIDRLRDCGGDYIALVAADQVLCLPPSDDTALTTMLESAFSTGADGMFFDGPPALGLARLRFLLDGSRPPHRSGAMALARDRQLLKAYGGAHVFQCVLLKRELAAPLLAALDAILDAVREGAQLDLGVYDVAVLPRLVGVEWLKSDPHPASARIHAALCKLAAATRRMQSISRPLQVFNVNVPAVLDHLARRIRVPGPDGGSP